MLFFSMYRYLFSLSRTYRVPKVDFSTNTKMCLSMYRGRSDIVVTWISTLTRIDLSDKKSKVIDKTLKHIDMTLDYLNKRVIILTWQCTLLSLNYDGVDWRLIFAGSSSISTVFSRIGSSMYFQKKTSSVVVKMDVISDYVWSTYCYPSGIIVVDRSMQSEGTFHMSNIEIKDVVNHVSSLTLNACSTTDRISCFQFFHFEINGVSCNLIGSQECDFSTNRSAIRTEIALL